MAGRFMRIKRVVIPFITLVILTSQLAGCATLTAQETLEESQKTSEVMIEYNELDPGYQDGQDDQNAIQVGNQQFVIDSQQSDTQNEATDTSIGLIDNQGQQEQELSELSGTELESYFQKAYDMGEALDGDIESRISTELSMLVDLVTRDNTGKLPEDYESQYKAWRPVEAAPEIQLFTDCNETVYATGTVNIRASYTADSAKLGSLAAGQSVTRTGTSIQGTEAEGWSRVTLSDGTTAYISNKYLSTTKPVQQSQSSQSTKPAQQQTQPASSGGKGDFVPGAGYNRGSVDTSDFVPITGVEGPVELTEEKIVEGWKGIQ